MTDEARQLRIIWIAFLVAVGVYAPIPFLLIGRGETDAGAVPENVRSAMSSAALGAGVASVLARRWWTNSLRAALERGAAAPVGGDPWARLRAGCVVTWALSEAVALIGLALAFVSRDAFAAVPLVAAAAALLLYHRLSNWPLEAVQMGGRSAA